MQLKWPRSFMLLLGAALVLLGGCAIFGTGFNDSRLFVARYEPRDLRLDDFFPSDPHSLEGYSVTDASMVSYPAIIAAGFNPRNELNAVLLSEEFLQLPHLFRFQSRGNPYRSRTMDFDNTIEQRIAGATVATDGTVIAVGHTGFRITSIGEIPEDFLLVSTTASGERNTAFGDNGRVETGFPAVTTGGVIPTADFATHITNHPSGGYYVAGVRSGRSLGTPDQFAIARYTDAGALDARFSGDGKKLALPRSATGGKLHSITTDARGQLLIAGVADYSVGPSKLFVGRFLNNGSLDTNFGTDGWMQFVRRTERQRITSVAPADDFVLVALSTGEINAYRPGGSIYNFFGFRPLGSTLRTGQTRVGPAISDFLAFDGAFYAIRIRDGLTYLVKLSFEGDILQERRIGISSGLFPDSEFAGKRLTTDGEYVYVVGLVQ